MPTITISNGERVLVNAKDHKRFAHLSWTASIVRGKTYAVNSRKTRKYLHRAILNFPKGLQVDHINGNTLDCRRSNLRICTNAQNNWNKKKHRDNTSGFKGIYFFKWGNRAKRWHARIFANGKVHKIGYFHTPEEAARAYDEKALKIHGEYASLNFPKKLQVERKPR